MCGILCFRSSKIYSFDELEQLSMSLEHRGPDYKFIGSIKQENNSLLNFITCQLMIVGSDPFPIKHNFSIGKSVESINTLVGNIEIYNYKSIYKEFLSSEFFWDESFSDAHIILPLLQKYLNAGQSIYDAFENVLKIMKGDYALIILLGREFLLVARDQVGIRPLYFSESDDNNLLFCSEVDPLLSLGTQINSIKTVAPGTFTVINLKEKMNSIQWQVMDDAIGKLCLTRSNFNENLLNIVENISFILKRAVKERIPSTNFALFLSGGIDSSLLLALILSFKPNQNFFVISVGFENSSDLIYAQKLCEYLNITLHKVTLNINDIREALPIIVKKLKQRFNTVNPIDVSIALPLYFASQKAKDLQCKVAITGQGADEIFIGYKKYYSQDVASDTNKVLKLVNKDRTNIALQNLERDDLISMHFSIEVRFPYLDIDLIKLIVGLNIQTLYSNNEEKRKNLLRNIAKKENLPSFITQRPKKAAQYGSSIMKNLYLLSKLSGSLKEYLESL